MTSCAADAVLTVAGHDHPVAAIGVGAAGADELFNSSGTADVPARSIPGTLDETERQHVVSAGWSIGRHVLADTSLLLAGASGGRLLRRIAVRSVWREVVSLAGQQPQDFLASVALPRLERLIAVAEHSARPWTEVRRPAAHATSPAAN